MSSQNELLHVLRVTDYLVSDMSIFIVDLNLIKKHPNIFVYQNDYWIDTLFCLKKSNLLRNLVFVIGYWYG
jgi:hypothetical protein